MTTIVHDGYQIVHDLLDAATVVTVTSTLDRIFDSEADIAVERRWSTETYRVAYALPVKDPAFIDVCCRPEILALVRSVLGDGAILATANGMDLPSGGPAQPLHRDHRVPTPGTTLYLHLVIALDPFRPERGSTRLVPGSHRGAWAALERDRLDQLEEQAIATSVDPGGAVAFDGALVHAAGANTTPLPRRALHLLYCRPWVEPHWDFPAMLTPAEASRLSDEQRHVFGLDRSRAQLFDRVERRIR